MWVSGPTRTGSLCHLCHQRHLGGVRIRAGRSHSVLAGHSVLSLLLELLWVPPCTSTDDSEGDHLIIAVTNTTVYRSQANGCFSEGCSWEM